MIVAEQSGFNLDRVDFLKVLLGCFVDTGCVVIDVDVLHGDSNRTKVILVGTALHEELFTEGLLSQLVKLLYTHFSSTIQVSWGEGKSGPQVHTERGFLASLKCTKRVFLALPLASKEGVDVKEQGSMSKLSPRFLWSWLTKLSFRKNFADPSFEHGCPVICPPIRLSSNLIILPSLLDINTILSPVLGFLFFKCLHHCFVVCICFFLSSSFLIDDVFHQLAEGRVICKSLEEAR